MAKTAVDSFKGGRNVKYLREAWIWGFRCAQEGKTEEPPSSDELWEWWNTIAIKKVSPSETNADDDCVVLTNSMKKMTLEEKPVEEEETRTTEEGEEEEGKEGEEPEALKTSIERTTSRGGIGR